MVEIVHGAIGAAVGQYFSSPILSFIFGFSSHFLIDIIPHGDSHHRSKWNILGKVGIFWWVIGFDIILCSLFVAITFGLNVYANPVSAVFGFTGALIPDLIIGASDLWKFIGFKNLILRRFYKFHFFFHDILLKYNFDFSLGTGLILQILILAIVLKIIF